MSNRRSLSYRASELLAPLCWSLLYLLRNRRQRWLTREEIRLARFSFSMFGEDLAIEELVNELGIEAGFYVDVGAFDPVYLSNTLLLFKRGWSGVNVDVDEQKIERFRRARPRDWSVACGVAKTAGRKKFAHYEEGRLTRQITESNDRSTMGDPALETFEVDTKPLQMILDDSPFHGRQIDFLNVDCEGRDLEVLESLDFAVYRPRLVAVEMHDRPEEAEIREFMSGQGYVVTNRLGLVRIFASRVELARLGLEG